MKKVLLAALAFATVFTACNDNDGDDKAKAITVTSTTITGEGIADVKKVEAAYGTNSTVLVAGVNVTDAKFTMTLPVPEDTKLTTIPPLGSDFTVSDKAAKLMTVYFNALDAAGEELGEIFLGGANTDETIIVTAEYVFSDRKVTISGTKKGTVDEDGERYDEAYTNFSLKKGWNIVYSVEVKTTEGTGEDAVTVFTETFTTTKPSTPAIGWVYEEADEPSGQN